MKQEWSWYVCISFRGPLPPLDLELYSRASQDILYDDGESEEKVEAGLIRPQIVLGAYALVHVEHPQTEKKFALVHEKDDRGWWYPGGGVDMGQTLTEAATVVERFDIEPFSDFSAK